MWNFLKSKTFWNHSTPLWRNEATSLVTCIILGWFSSCTWVSVKQWNPSFALMQIPNTQIQKNTNTCILLGGFLLAHEYQWNSEILHLHLCKKNTKYTNTKVYKYMHHPWVVFFLHMSKSETVKSYIFHRFTNTYIPSDEVILICTSLQFGKYSLLHWRLCFWRKWHKYVALDTLLLTPVIDFHCICIFGSWMSFLDVKYFFLSKDISKSWK